MQDQYLCVEFQDGHDLDDEMLSSKCAKGYTYSDYQCLPVTFNASFNQSIRDFLEKDCMIHTLELEVS